MKRRNAFFAVCLAAVFATLAAAPAAAETGAVSVAFAKDSVTLSVGTSVTVTATVSPYEAVKAGVAYAVSDESVATVSEKGRVTAVAAGECVLTAVSLLDPSASASVPVRVVVPVSRLTVTAESDAVFVGRTLQLHVSCSPGDATEQGVTFASNRESVATVTSGGLVVGVKRGSATITVTSADGNTKTTFKVDVRQAPETVDIAPQGAEGTVGEKTQLTATVLPENANDRTVEWSSADENVAVVSKKGVVTFTGVGETTVTAVCSDAPGVTASVTVRALQLADEVAFDSLGYTVLLGGSAQLYASVLPADTADPSLTYKSADPSVAAVDENGVVTGVSAGRTTVYATAADGSNRRASATVTVVVPVTGVGYPYKDVRVGVGESASFTAVLAPAGATDTRMTWQSGDESVATVSGTANRFTVLGRSEGRCKLTGVTADGGYTVTVYADVGSLTHAAVITAIGLRDGKPYVVVQNLSGMELTQVRFRIRGYDETFMAVPVGTDDDGYVLSGAVNVVLGAGESSAEEDTVLYHAADYTGLAALQACVTGWTTTTGFYDANGQLQKNCNLRQSAWEWVAWPASATTGLPSK